MEIIAVENLTKFYGKNRGIEDLSFTVEAGSIFGFLGPNGAGKTTTIRILLDIVRPTAGRVRLFGQDLSGGYPAELRRSIGYLPGELRLYEELSGKAYLDLMGGFYGKVDQKFRGELLEELDLNQADLQRRLEGYSKGMKQKIGILQALQHNPDLLILDEPTEGLDPLMRSRFYRILRRLSAEGKTIFMSSHNLSEVEQVCERVSILREGRLLTTQSVEELKSMRLYRVEMEFLHEADAAAFQLEGARMEGEGKTRILHWRGEFSQLFASLNTLPLADFTCQKAGLEEIFLAFYEKEGEAQ